MAAELELPHIDAMLDLVLSIGPAEIAARHCAEGTIAEAHGDPEGAARAFDEAAAGYEELELRPWEAITRLGKARTLHATGRRGEADDALRAARAIIEGLRATPWIAKCDQLATGATSPTERRVR